jgi:hypothetical protein
LLGLLREERSVAADVLAARGLRIEAVREAIVELLSRGEQPEPPGPPPTPANTYQWPWIPFVPSRTVHILHQEIVVTLTFASWNQVATWLRRLEGLKGAA